MRFLHKDEWDFSIFLSLKFNILIKRIIMNHFKFRVRIFGKSLFLLFMFVLGS